MPAPPASPRAVRRVCFVAAALLTSTVSMGVSGAAAAPRDPEATTTAPASADPTTTTATTTTTPPESAAPSIDVLRDDADQVRVALADTVAKRGAAQSGLAAARADVEAARAAETTAAAAEQDAAAKAKRLDTEVRAAAVDAYIGTGHDVPLGVLTTHNSEDAAWQSTVLQYNAEKLASLLAEQRAAHHELEAERRDRADAAAAAEASEQRAAEQVDQLVDLENAQTALVAKVDDRLDAALAEASALAAVDQQAAAALASKEQELANAAALSLTTPAPAAKSPAKVPASKAPATTTTTTNPTTTIAPGPTPPPTSAVPVVVPTGPLQPPAPVDVVTVGGFVVARSIADQFSQLLAAASSAGISLGGSAYRDVNTQIDLRRQHCGTSDFEIWQKPASQCSPPTAIPGRSMHERGLAIDFTCLGILVSNRASPCFAWLASNAAGFGFYNLPSEPWHWSTNGN